MAVTNCHIIAPLPYSEIPARIALSSACAARLVAPVLPTLPSHVELVLGFALYFHRACTGFPMQIYIHRGFELVHLQL